jgi:phosphatidylglycerophosphate synthase
MDFFEFQSKSFPERSVFDRKQFDSPTNLVKWFAMRCAYLLYRMGSTANFLDGVGILVAVFSFGLLATAVVGARSLVVLGVAGLYLHLFIDFADGPIAKARGNCSAVGAALDNLGADIDRMVLLVLFGMFTGSPFLILLNAFSGFILIVLLPQTSKHLSKEGWTRTLVTVYAGRFSLIGCRFMLVILPLLLMVLVLLNFGIEQFSQIVSGFYAMVAVLWLLICIVPSKNSTDKGSR